MIDAETKERLLKLIAYLETTTDDQWLMKRVRSKDQTKNCCLGHVFAMGGEDEKLSNDWWNWFEESIATTYMIYPVNDGKHPDYPQNTPKLRILAYLNDVIAGTRMTTHESRDASWEEFKKSDAYAEMKQSHARPICVELVNHDRG